MAEPPRPGPAAAGGFTLLEVLVALAVLAVALAAAVSGTATQADNTGYLRDRTLAQWVAGNQLTAAQLEADWPATGTRRGEETLAGREWAWTVEVSATPDPAVRMLEARAAPADHPDRVLARVTGYSARPGEAAP